MLDKTNHYSSYHSKPKSEQIMTTFAFTKEKTWQEKLIDQVLETNKKSFRTSLKVYGELLVRKGNKWVKNTNPVPMQRLSKKRAETDVLKPYYFKKNPDTGRCMGYNSSCRKSWQ
jgi:hypothetical protein